MILYSTLYFESRALMIESFTANVFSIPVHSKSTRRKGYSGARGKLIFKKNLKPKSCVRLPLKVVSNEK
jgi:hypothetical protein